MLLSVRLEDVRPRMHRGLAFLPIVMLLVSVVCAAAFGMDDPEGPGGAESRFERGGAVMFGAVLGHVFAMSRFSLSTQLRAAITRGSGAGLRAQILGAMTLCVAFFALASMAPHGAPEALSLSARHSDPSLENGAPLAAVRGVDPVRRHRPEPAAVDVGLLAGAFALGLGTQIAGTCVPGALANFGALAGPEALIVAPSMLAGIALASAVSADPASRAAARAREEGGLLSAAVAPLSFLSPPSAAAVVRPAVTVAIAVAVIALSAALECWRRGQLVDVSHSFRGISDPRWSGRAAPSSSSSSSLAPFTSVSSAHPSLLSSDPSFPHPSHGGDPSAGSPLGCTPPRWVMFGPWPWSIGGIVLGALEAAFVITSGEPWSVSAPAEGWTRVSDPLPLGVLGDVRSLACIGFVIGSGAAACLSGTFALSTNRGPPFGARKALGAIIGGLTLGWGSFVGGGGNVAAFTVTVAAGHLTGWVWLAAALAGAAVGVFARPAFGLLGEEGTGDALVPIVRRARETDVSELASLL